MSAAAARRVGPPATGAAVLGVVLWRTGTGPALAGLEALDRETVLLAVLLAVLTTVANAWRWHLVSRALGIGVRVPTAVAWCYRSQFLNATLPSGVVGDLHRGLRHGRAVGTPGLGGLGVRAVAWERVSGQAVQVALVLVTLVLLPSPLRGHLPEVAAALGAGAVGTWMLVTSSRAGTSLAPRLVRAVLTDLRRALLTRRTWPGVVLASAVAVAGYVATYLLAARAVGVTGSVERLTPLVLVVLLAAALPVNLAGWGPREGVAAWSFGAAGLGAAQGLATAVAYGALVVVGTLPGAVVLVLGVWRRPPAGAVGRPAAAARTEVLHG